MSVCGATEEEQNINLSWSIIDDAWIVLCDKCGASGGMNDGREDAIEAWNRRTDT